MDTILLIDDDRITSYLHEKLFRKLNLRAELVIKTNGREALLYLEDCYSKLKCWPSHIFLDLNMPVINGVEFLRKFKKINLHNIPVTIVTSYEEQQYINEIKSLGNYHIISKPLTLEKVTSIFKKE